MEFFDLDYEVESGQTLNVYIAEGKVLRLRNAKLGKEIDETVFLEISVDGKQLVAGKLNPHRQPQQDLKMMIDKDFKISHTGSNGIVYLSGYITDQTTIYSSNDDEEEETAKKEEGN
ncbi:hypothetical protein OROMI_007863 [Orobanche minor]